MRRKPASSERPQHRRGKPPVDGGSSSGAGGFSRYKFIAIIALLVVVVMAAGWNWFPEAPAGQVVATTAKNERFLAMPAAAGARQQQRSYRKTRNASCWSRNWNRPIRRFAIMLNQPVTRIAPAR
jgi:hypothetical protein